MTRTASSPTGGEALIFWVYGDIEIVPIVPTPCSPEPVANAGPDKTVFDSQTVTLDGSASIGEGLTYCWTQVDGPDVGLPECSDATALDPTVTFTAPGLPTTLAFELQVRNACDLFSLPDTVVVTVINCPATVVLQGDSTSLQTLSLFRDQVLADNPIGQKVIDGYHAHGAELTQILLTQPRYRQQALRLIREFLPKINQAIDGKPVMIRRAEMKTVFSLLNDLRTAASPKLAEFLAWSQRQLADDSVLNQFGVRIH